VIEKADKM